MGDKWKTEPGSWDRVKEVGGAYGRGILDSILGIPAAAERAVYGPGAYIVEDQTVYPDGNIRYDKDNFISELLGFAVAPMAPGAARTALGKSPLGGVGSNFGSAPEVLSKRDINTAVEEIYRAAEEGTLTPEQFSSVPRSVVNQIGNLDMSPDAVAERADWLFPETQFHGTTKDFEQFSLDMPYADLGVHMGPSEQAHSRVADLMSNHLGYTDRLSFMDSQWSGKPGNLGSVDYGDMQPNVWKLRVDPGNVLGGAPDVSNWDNPMAAARGLSDAARINQKPELADEFNSLRYKIAEDKAQYAVDHGIYDRYDMNSEAFRTLRKALAGGGYDSVRYLNEYEPLFKNKSGPVDFAGYLERRQRGDYDIRPDEELAPRYSYIIPDLSRVRSPHAGFDPRFKKYPLLFGSLAGSVVLSDMDVGAASEEIERYLEESRY